jgi:hypothetical protein
MTGALLGTFAALLAGTALVLWFQRMHQVALAGRRTLPFALCAAAIVVAVLAFLRAPGWIGGLLAAIGLAIGAAWIALGLLARQSGQRPAVAVGMPLPELVAPDETGASFDIASLRGHPVLIKLFRGHW